ncbi:MAG: zinc finger domain-containing protein [Candidatus Poseidoniaceae archaeon]
MMSERATTCSTSGIPLTQEGATSFPCPGCGEPIGRSPRARNQGVVYVCASCGFQGP